MARKSIVPKEKKGSVKRFLASREPKIIENTKKVACIRGEKTSQTVIDFLTDMHRLKKPHSVFLKKKNDIHIFEDETKVEFLTAVNDASLFVIGNSNKKRPNNIVMGRMYDGHVLDMIELGINSYQKIDDFKGDTKRIGSSPVLVFQGEKWDTDDDYAKVKNIFIDFFRCKKIDSFCLASADNSMVFTVDDGGNIYMRNYSLAVLEDKTDRSNGSPQIDPMGPSAEFEIRRKKFAAEQLWKKATAKPQMTIVKKRKNIITNEVGEQLGRVHLGEQNLGGMNFKKKKALLPNKRIRQEPQSVVENAETVSNGFDS